jgi:hypothetical protein
VRDPQLEHLIYYSSRACDVKVRPVFHPRPSSYILKGRTTKRPKTPIGGSIVEAFQTVAALAQENYKLKHLAEQFRLADNLI